MALSSKISLNCLRNVKLQSSAARMSSKASGDTERVPQHSNDELVCENFKSRNPRNLELMQIAYKPFGYQLDKYGRMFWNKLLVKPSQNFVKAEIIHNSGRVITSASSAEWGIKKQLYRYTDSCAYKAVGMVLAHRALECGINNVHCVITADEGTKLDILLRAVEAGGLSLEEKPRFMRPDPFAKIQQTPSWEDLKLV